MYTAAAAVAKTILVVGTLFFFGTTLIVSVEAGITGYTHEDSGICTLSYSAGAEYCLNRGPISPLVFDRFSYVGVPIWGKRATTTMEGNILHQYHSRVSPNISWDSAARTACTITATNNNTAVNNTVLNCYTQEAVGAPVLDVEVPPSYSVEGFSFSQVSVSLTIACGVRVSGSIVCWSLGPPPPAGRSLQNIDAETLATVPSAANFVQVHVSLASGACALTFQGSAVCWPPVTNPNPPPPTIGGMSVVRLDAATYLVENVAGAFTLGPTHLSDDGHVACAFREMGRGGPDIPVCWGRDISASALAQLTEEFKLFYSVSLVGVMRFADVNGTMHSAMVTLIDMRPPPIHGVRITTIGHGKRIKLWLVSTHPLAAKNDPHSIFMSGINNNTALFVSLKVSGTSLCGVAFTGAAAVDSFVGFPVVDGRHVLCFSGPGAPDPTIPPEIETLAPAGGDRNEEVFMSPCRRCVVLYVVFVGYPSGYQLHCWVAPNSSCAALAPIAIPSTFRSSYLAVGDDYVCGIISKGGGVVVCYGAREFVEGVPSPSTNLYIVQGMFGGPGRVCVTFLTKQRVKQHICWGREADYNRPRTGVLRTDVSFESISIADDTICGQVSKNNIAAAATDVSRAGPGPVNGVLCAGPGGAASTYPVEFDPDARGLYAASASIYVAMSLHCTLGTYSFGSGSATSMCSGLCATGTWGDGTDPTAQCRGPCPLGHFCPPQHLQWGKTKAPCPLGTYQGQVGQTQCKSCQAGTFAARNASSACVDCAPGSFQDKPQQSSCTLCAQGSFQTTGGNPECFQCAPGRFSSVAGSIECSPCSTNSFAASVGSATCIPCPAGQFSAGGNTTGAVSCLSCPPGSEYRGGQCQLCGVGTFRPPDTAATSIVGSSKNRHDNIKCAPCPPGHYQDQTGAVGCIPCALGTVASRMGSPQCLVCSPGSFQERTQQTACVECASGKFSDGAGSGSCRVCPDGHTTLAAAQQACIPCSDEWRCANGEPPILQRGFWPTTNVSRLQQQQQQSEEGNGDKLHRLGAFPCPEGLCVADHPDKTCGPGRLDPPSANVLCGRCAAGFALVGSKCVECERANWGGILLALAAALAFVTIALIQSRGASSGRYSSFLYFVQTALLMLGPYRNWRLAWLDVFNFAPDQAASSAGYCLAPVDPVHLQVLGLCLPLIFVICLLVVATVRWGICALRARYRAAFRRPQPPPTAAVAAATATAARMVRATYARTLISLYLFAYTRMAVLTATYLRCEGVDNDVSVVYLVPAIDCFSPIYTSWLPLFVSVLVVYLVGIPCAMLLYLVRRHRRRKGDILGNDDAGGGSSSSSSAAYANRVWGILFEPYKQTRFFAGVLVLFRRALMVSANIAFVLDTEVRIMVFCIMNVCFLCLHMWLRPFKNEASNRIESGLLWLLTVLSALLTSRARPLSPGISAAVTLVVVVPSVACIAYFVWQAALRRWRPQPPPMPRVKSSSSSSSSSSFSSSSLPPPLPSRSCSPGVSTISGSRLQHQQNTLELTSIPVT